MFWKSNRRENALEGAGTKSQFRAKQHGKDYHSSARWLPDTGCRGYFLLQSRRQLHGDLLRAQKNIGEQNPQVL